MLYCALNLKLILDLMVTSVIILTYFISYILYWFLTLVF